jgi:HAE1 family hydrophobic/amphiphilic exporter-1
MPTSRALGFDWTGISREEVKAGSLAVVIFALGILAVFLVLSAQYESYSDPIIILLTVPTALLGALVFLGGGWSGAQYLCPSWSGDAHWLGRR